MADGTTTAPQQPSIDDAPALARYSLRTRSPAGLPSQVLTSAEYGDGHALCLGPDEWLLLLPEGASPPAVAGAHSLVDIAHRQVGLTVTGAAATTLIQRGCALDLSDTAFPVGRATRTLYEGVEIVLWRRARDRFQLEVWRSFAPYLRAMLIEPDGA